MSHFSFFVGTDLAKPTIKGEEPIYREHFELHTDDYHLVGGEAKREIRAGHVDEAFLKDKKAREAYDAWKNPAPIEEIKDVIPLQDEAVLGEKE